MNWEKMFASLSDESLTNIIETATAKIEERREAKRKTFEMEINGLATEVASAANICRDDFECCLRVKTIQGRMYVIPLNARAIANWGIEVSYRKNKGED